MVRKAAEESLVVHVEDAAERTKRQIGRPSMGQNFRKQVVGILEETPDLASWRSCDRCDKMNHVSKSWNYLRRKHDHFTAEATKSAISDAVADAPG